LGYSLSFKRLYEEERLAHCAYNNYHICQKYTGFLCFSVYTERDSKISQRSICLLD
jgi:hypothetical protein